MQNIMVKSYLFLLDGGFGELPIDLAQFQEELERNHLELISYSEGITLIQKLGLEEYAHHHKGFTYLNKNLRIIFYKDSLPYGEKLFVIAHEIAHFALNHTAVGLKGKSETVSPASVQEREADTFAYNLLAPQCVLEKLQVDTVSEIKKITLLDEMYAKKVMQTLKIAKYKQWESTLTKTEQQLLKQFEEFIKDYTHRNSCKKKRRLKYIILISLIPIILAIQIVNFKIITTHQLSSQIETEVFTDISPQPTISAQAPPASAPVPTPQPQKYSVSRQESTNPTQHQQTTTSTPNQTTFSSEQSTPPTMRPEPEPVQEKVDESMSHHQPQQVYVTKTGKKFHKQDCHHIKNSVCIELPLDKALKLYEPCKSCNPLQSQIP